MIQDIGKSFGALVLRRFVTNWLDQHPALSLCSCLRGVQLIQRALMLMLWMCCLCFSQEEKNELGLLLGAEVIAQATPSSNQQLSFGKSIASSGDYARRRASVN